MSKKLIVYDSKFIEKIKNYEYRDILTSNLFIGRDSFNNNNLNHLKAASQRNKNNVKTKNLMEPILKTVIYSFLLKSFRDYSKSHSRSFNLIVMLLSYTLYEVKNMTRVFLICNNIVFTKQFRSSFSLIKKIIISNYLKVSKRELILQMDVNNIVLTPDILKKIIKFNKSQHGLLEKMENVVNLSLQFYELVKNSSVHRNNNKKFDKIGELGQTIFRQKKVITEGFKRILKASPKNLRLIKLYKIYQTKIMNCSSKDLTIINELYQIALYESKNISYGLLEYKNERRFFEDIMKRDTFTIVSFLKTESQNYQQKIDGHSKMAPRVFGYTDKEFKNMRLSRLMTSKVAQHHNSYVLNYINRGVFINKKRHPESKVFAVNKEGLFISLEFDFQILLSLNHTISICALGHYSDFNKEPFIIFGGKGKLEGFNKFFKDRFKISNNSLKYTKSSSQGDNFQLKIKERELFTLIPSLSNIIFRNRQRERSTISRNPNQLFFDREDPDFVNWGSDGHFNCFCFMKSNMFMRMNTNKINDMILKGKQNRQQKQGKTMMDSIGLIADYNGKRGGVENRITQKMLKKKIQEFQSYYFIKNRQKYLQTLRRNLLEVSLEMNTIEQKHSKIKVLRVKSIESPEEEVYRFFRFTLSKMNRESALLLAADRIQVKEFCKF